MSQTTAAHDPSSPPGPTGPQVSRSGARRRARLLGAAAAALVLVATAACTAAEGTTGPDEDGVLPLTAELPTEVPPGTKLVIGDPQTQKAIELADGAIDADFSFEIEWANISGGPATTEAFRAGALDAGSVAEIPGIHATWTGLDVRYFASVYRENWAEAPVYEFAGSPGVTLESLEDFRGHRIAFSPGQAQGAIVLKALQAAGLSKEDVELVELPSTGDVYSTALAAGEVDIAPLGGTQLKRYLGNYADDGAQSVKHHLRDDASHLYGPVETVEDPAKAAALREYLQAWAAAKIWISENPEIWKQGYFIEDQGLDEEDAQFLIDHAAIPDIPSDLAEPIARTQEVVDLLAAELDQPVLDAADLFDARFVPVIAAAAEEARS